MKQEEIISDLIKGELRELSKGSFHAHHEHTWYLFST